MNYNIRVLVINVYDISLSTVVNNIKIANFHILGDVINKNAFH